VNGANPGQNSIYMDGISITNSSSNGNLSQNTNDPGIGFVEPDAIQEFKIQTSMFDAGYGRNAGASINVITKSGTNDLHGSAFEFFRNTVLNANDFFLNAAGKPRPALDQNQYGGTVGGRIKKDKLFFFASYQQLWQKNGAASQGLSNPAELPIPGTSGAIGSDRGSAANQAVLAAQIGAEYCPTVTSGPQAGQVGGPNGTSTLNGGLQVACNGSNINPAALNLLQLKVPGGGYAIPSFGSQLTSTLNTKNGEYVSGVQVVPFSIPANYQEEQALGNLDYVINGKNTLAAHYFVSHVPENAPFGCTNGVCYPGTGISYTYWNHYANLQLTSIASNNLVNVVKFAISRGTVAALTTTPFFDSANCPGATGSLSAGIAPIQCNLNQLDNITVTGDFEIGAAGGVPTLKFFDSWVAGDDVSWTHGKHTIRFGGEYERDRYDWYFESLSVGSMTFPTFADFLLGLPGCSPSVPSCSPASPGNTNGSAFSNMSNNGNFQSETPPGGLNHAYRDPYVDFYFQDDLKLTRKLTVNLGLRWEYLPIMIDAKGYATNINPYYINSVPIPGNSAIGCPNPAFTSAADPCVPGSLAGFVVPSNFPFSQFTAPAVGGLIQSQHKGFQPQNTPLDDFSPRIGLAWSPLDSNRLTVRSGFGIFDDRSGALNYIGGITQAIPYAAPLFQTGQANYAASLQTPYILPPNPWTPRTVDFTTGLSSNLTETLTTPSYNTTPKTYQWNLTMQYQFLPTWTIDLGYVGAHSVHAEGAGGIPSYTFQELNGPVLAGFPGSNIAPAVAAGAVTTNTVSNASLRVPYLGFSPSGLGAFADDYSSKYNGAQVTVRKQLSHGVTLNAAYTWSRTFASLFAYNNPNVATYEQNVNYHPQRLTINYQWDIPASYQGLLGKVANGWGVSGVTIVQDGVPLTITNALGGTIYGSVNPATAEYCPGMGAGNVASAGSDKQRLGGKLSGTGWFNTSAVNCTPPVALNANGTATNGTGWGDVPPSIILGPGQFNTDLTLIKTTKVGGIHEDASLVFRTEFFNVFNHAQFSNPGTLSANSSTFGYITSSSVNPRLIQFALKYIF
jgi:hypothetical protein